MNQVLSLVFFFMELECLMGVSALIKMKLWICISLISVIYNSTEQCPSREICCDSAGQQILFFET
jgi:hypothetical protein